MSYARMEFNHLPNLADLFTGDEIDAALFTGGLVVEADAKRSAPVVTGNLRRSLHTVGNNRIHSEGGDAPSLPSPGHGEVHVGTNVEYARRIELGFVGADSLGRVYNQEGQPYLLPALEQNKGEIERTIAASLNDLIEKLP
jgi:hypothetical protein